MKNPRLVISLVASLLAAPFSVPAYSQVTVGDPWIRGTVSGQTVTGAFMRLTSTTDTQLVGATSPAAKTVEIHEMTNEGGMMKMRALPALALPAGKRVDLAPGGYHMMLVDLVQPLNVGESVPLTLTFSDKAGNKQTVEVKAVVKSLTTSAPAMR